MLFPSKSLCWSDCALLLTLVSPPSSLCPLLSDSQTLIPLNHLLSLPSIPLLWALSSQTLILSSLSSEPSSQPSSLSPLL